MIKYKWCHKNSKDPSRYYYTSFCMQWVCLCGHSLYEHWKSSTVVQECGFNSSDIRIKTCNCNKFKYSNNDFCDIECQFNRKVYEINETKNSMV